nr:hypothetical protein [Tanacetum cinerariifolium]
MGYEHLSITLETESDEVTESNAKNLLPIPSECEITLEDEKECDVPISENSPICDDHYDIISDSKINDDISIYDDDFEDIEYVEASLSDPEIFSVEDENGVEEENVVLQEEVDLKDISQIQDIVLQTRSGNTTHADNSLPKYDSFCFEIEPDQERLINLMKSDIPDESSNDPLLEEADLFLASDNSIPLEEADLFLSDDSIPPGIENVADDPEGDVRFLEELLIDDSILSHDNFEDNPSISRPPPEPPNDNFDLEPEDGLRCKGVTKQIVGVIPKRLALRVVLEPPAVATWQHPIGQPPVTWYLRQHGQRRRSTTVNAAGHRSTTADHGGDRRSTTVAGGEPPLTAAGPPLPTTGPPVNGGWWAGQRSGLGRSGSGLGRVWIGSGPGLGWVWIGSGTWHVTCRPRVHTCKPSVPTWHPCGC